MDQEKITKSIKENKGILRQLTSLNNEIRQLKGRVRKLEKNQHTRFVLLPDSEMSKEEIANIKVGGTG